MKKAVVLLSLTLLFAGCGAKIYNKGKLFTDEEKVSFAKVKSKKEALDKLGTPSATTMFDQDETWIYFGSIMRQTAFFNPYYEKYELNLIKFSGNNVASRQTLTLKDKKEIDIYSGSTEIKGAKELNPFEELIGNVGRFSTLPSQM